MFDKTDSGLPQRFLWADVRDPETPIQAEPTPAVLASLSCFPMDTDKQLPKDPDMGVLQAYYNPTADGIHSPSEYPRTYMSVTFPQSTREDFEHSRSMTHRGRLSDPLDAHRLMVTAKVAALLAFLNRPQAYPNVEELDWDNAKTILEHSSGYRTQSLQAMKQARSRQKADEIEIVDSAKNEVRSRGIETAKTRIMDYLHDVHFGKEGMKGWRISQHVTRAYRPYVYPALEELHEEGHISICGQDTGKASSNAWKPTP
ncbi:MAG: hypothetical protein M3Z40_07070 [Bifidobacterium sp.]|nr:hypothetical protein [Bifidobacterium sp.]